MQIITPCPKFYRKTSRFWQKKSKSSVDFVRFYRFSEITTPRFIQNDTKKNVDKPTYLWYYI